MSTKYKATVPDTAYFVTTTTVGWIDIFTRPDQKQVIINSLRHCQQHKGLEIYAYCLMSNHLHMICKAEKGLLSDIIRDFKNSLPGRSSGPLKNILKAEGNGCWIYLIKPVNI